MWHSAPLLSFLFPRSASSSSSFSTALTWFSTLLLWCRHISHIWLTGSCCNLDSNSCQTGLLNVFCSDFLWSQPHWEGKEFHKWTLVRHTSDVKNISGDKHPSEKIKDLQSCGSSEDSGPWLEPQGGTGRLRRENGRQVRRSHVSTHVITPASF